MRKFNLLLFIMLLLFCANSRIFALDSGFTLQLKSQFAGSYTMPKISDESLHYLNNRATNMAGGMSNLLLGFDAEVGYIFRADDFFKMKKKSVFSGLGIFVYLGFSQGNTSQKITAEEADQAFDIYMSVDFLPIVNLGVTGKIYLFNTRLALGLSVGARIIADMTPEYLCYSSDPDIIPTEVGTVIINEDTISNANPVMFSSRFNIEYNIPILPTVELVLGAYVQFNLFRPNKLTIPPSLLSMAVADNPDFDINRAYPDYWLNSFDFGVNISLAFKL